MTNYFFFQKIKQIKPPKSSSKAYYQICYNHFNFYFETKMKQ